jgi:hypothetical protein
MRVIKVTGIFAIAVLCAAAEKPGLQGAKFVSHSMGFPNGVSIKATVAVEPPAPLKSVFENMSFAIYVNAPYETYHRVIEDSSRRAYFGYDISTEPIPNTDRIRVTIAPLSMTVDELEADQGAQKVSGFRFLVLPRYPAPVIVENGDTIALDLLVSPDGKQKIVDYLEISYKPATNPKH